MLLKENWGNCASSLELLDLPTSSFISVSRRFGFASGEKLPLGVHVHAVWHGGVQDLTELRQ